MKRSLGLKPFSTYEVESDIDLVEVVSNSC